MAGQNGTISSAISTKRIFADSCGRMLRRLLFEDIRVDDLFLDVVGKPEVLPVRSYPQAVATALALRHRWQRDRPDHVSSSASA